MKKIFLIHISIVFILFAFISCNTVSENSEVNSEVKKPNVIIVITDDQGYGDLGSNGNSVIKTPTIDKFAQNAISLTNYHVATTCAPTRAGLFTGRNCNRNGVWHTIVGASILNRDEVTLSDVFQQNNYATGMFGKWHLGDNHPFLPHERGFDEAFYHGGGGVGQTPDYWDNDYFDDTFHRNGKPEKVEGYCTDVWFDEALKFIENKKDDPFFCYISLNAPHSPFNVPQEYYDLYKDEPNLLEIQKRFYGMITNIDDNFSKLITKLEDLKIKDNTILIFTTDNGTSCGYKKDRKTKEMLGFNAGMRGTKASQYDGGHRVPFLMQWKDGGLVGGEKLDELIAHVDLLPTLASLTNIDFTPSKVLDGVDVSDYLTKGEKPKKRMVITDTQRIQWPEKGRKSCVMNGDWRLVDGNELYNLSEDPGQGNNIASQHPDKVAEMNAFYEKWWASVIEETKYSIIDIGSDSLDVITCHDTHSGESYPPWNQQLIRKGEPMIPAKYLLNFTEANTYKFSLMRWPHESNLSLGAECDGNEGSAYTDEIIAGKSMKFKKAFLKIGDKEHSFDVNNDLTSASIELEVEKGETDLTAWFEMENGVLTNAFYVSVEKIN